VKDIAIRIAQPSDRDQLARMCEALWPESSTREHAQELAPILAGQFPGLMPLVILVSQGSDGTLAGFIEVGLRSSADGCNPSRPVGYVEGWYVAENRRQQGLGRALLRAAEVWARDQGCVEMASDTLIENRVSQRVHEALGFEVVDRCVTYRKAL
jgi:aminoglycoside 6'-N-acetyltransferase I